MIAYDNHINLSLQADQDRPNLKRTANKPKRILVFYPTMFTKDMNVLPG